MACNRSTEAKLALKVARVMVMTTLIVTTVGFVHGMDILHMGVLVIGQNVKYVSSTPA